MSAENDRLLTSGDGSEPQPLAIDGDILSGRLFVWADTLALGLVAMADRFDEMDPMILLAAGQTPGRILRDIGAQLAQAAVQYGDGRYDETEQS